MTLPNYFFLHATLQRVILQFETVRDSVLVQIRQDVWWLLEASNRILHKSSF